MPPISAATSTLACIIIQIPPAGAQWLLALAATAALNHLLGRGQASAFCCKDAQQPPSYAPQTSNHQSDALIPQGQAGFRTIHPIEDVDSRTSKAAI